MDLGALSLAGRVAVVVGGAGGIGEATVRLLLARGARVAIADRDRDRAAALAEEFGADTIAVAVELTDEASVGAMIAAAHDWGGRLDILHNNAALLDPAVAMRDRDVETMAIEVWDATFAVNVRGAMLTARAALPHLVATGNGAIVNTVSNLALQGHIVQAAYAASKAALIQLTRSIATSHGRRGVRCNAVAPGLTATPRVLADFPADVRRLVEQETLRDRLGSPEDIAEAVAFLASEAARNITGHVLVADGGLASHVPGLAGYRALGGEAS